MAMLVNEAEVDAEPIGKGVKCQKLLTPARVPGSNVLLNRLALEPGADLTFTVPAGSIAWIQVLSGVVTLSQPGGSDIVSESYVLFLPPAFHLECSADQGAVLLHAEVPEASRFDGSIKTGKLQFRIVDWTREPVLQSQHDARRRIYLATPQLFGTKAIKGEMIIYPPGTAASNHHHEGAEHFMFFLRGRGTTYVNEQPFSVRKGDLVFYHTRERHYLVAAQDEEMTFVEFFVPGECRTIWVDSSQVCTWASSGRDIRGRKPVRDIERHSSAELLSPEDV